MCKQTHFLVSPIQDENNLKTFNQAFSVAERLCQAVNKPVVIYQAIAIAEVNEGELKLNKLNTDQAHQKEA